MTFGIFAGIVGSSNRSGWRSDYFSNFNNIPKLSLYFIIGISLLSTISTSLSSSLTYIKKKITNDNKAISLLTATTFGAIFGFLLNNYLYTHNLFFIVYIIFGCCIIIIFNIFDNKEFKREILSIKA